MSVVISVSMITYTSQLLSQLFMLSSLAATCKLNKILSAADKYHSAQKQVLLLSTLNAMWVFEDIQ